MSWTTISEKENSPWGILIDYVVRVVKIFQKINTIYRLVKNPAGCEFPPQAIHPTVSAFPRQ